VRPDGGHATVCDHDVVRHAHQVRQLTGLTGQYASVDETLTGLENLMLIGRLTGQSRPAARSRAGELLASFRLEEAADRAVKTYSGGMRRRLDLGASLVGHPSVIYLDEPTTGLDPSGRSDLWSLIEQLVADGTTVLLTTQYLEEADRLADNIIVIDDGRIIAQGTSAELKAGLGSTIIEVRLLDAASAQRASAGFRGIGPSEVGDDGRTVEIHVTEGGRCVLEVARILDANQLVPDTVAIREPTLDDVFLQLTGHRAEDAPPGAEPVAGGSRRGREEGAA